MILLVEILTKQSKLILECQVISKKYCIHLISKERKYDDINWGWVSAMLILFSSRKALSDSAWAKVCTSKLVCGMPLTDRLDLVDVRDCDGWVGRSRLCHTLWSIRLPNCSFTCLTLSLTVKPVKRVKLVFTYTQSFVFWMWLLPPLQTDIRTTMICVLKTVYNVTNIYRSEWVE